MNIHNNNEYLFWKVFHNKFLLNKIFNYIHSMEWVVYDDHSQLHIDNRLKFKDIHSLEWMFENKQYQLLNNKLDHNDYIEINKKSISTLFNQLSIDNNNNNTNNNEIIKQVLNKLLSKRRDEFEILDLTKEAVKSNSIEVLRILINEPYSIPIYPSTLEFAIENSHPLIVEELLKINNNDYLGRNNNLEFNKIKEKSFELALKNNLYQSEMVKFVLFKFNLESSVSSTTNQLSETMVLQDSSLSNSNSSSSSDLSSIRSTTSVSSSSPSPSSSSSSNDLVNESGMLFKSFIQRFQIDTIMELPFQETYSIYQVLSRGESNSTINIDSIISLKQLQGLIIIKLKQQENQFQDLYFKFYQNYICKYKQVIDECHYSNQENDGANEINEQELNFKNLFKISDIFGVLKDKEDKQSIIKDCNNGKLVYNQLLLDLILTSKENDPIVINDISTVDWLLGISNSTIESFIHSNISKFTFETLELADYVYKKNEKFRNLPQVYYHIWNEAIKQSDFNTIKYIESLNNNNIYNIGLNLSKIKPQLSNCQIIKFINYFNENGWNGFNNENFEVIIDQISKLLLFNQNDIQLNFKNESFEIIRTILKKSLSEMDLKTVKLLLNCNLFNNGNQIIFQNIDELEFNNHFEQLPRYLFKGEVVYHFQESQIGSGGGSGTNRYEIIEIIKLIISKLNSTTSIIKTNDPISVIVNNLFEKLIQIKGIKMNEIKPIYQLIQENSIIIKHDLYHCFYYLHIKDISFTYYILSPHYLHLYFDRREDEYYNCSNYNPNLLNLEDNLSISDFTFEAINYSLSFEQVMEMLIVQLSRFENVFNYINFYDLHRYQIITNDHINTELEFYLIIRRQDLFFKKLKFIKLTNDKELLEPTLNFNLDEYSHWTYPANSILYDSPFNTILKSSNLFNNHNDDYLEPPMIKQEIYQDFKKYEFQPMETVAHTFTFHNKLVKCICKVLDLDQIKSILKFNLYQQSFQNLLLHESIIYRRFDISKLILDNFEFTITYDEFAITTITSSPFLIENYLNKIQYPCKFKILKMEQYNKLFKFKFLQFLEVYFLEDENDKEKTQFIDETTSNQVRYEIIKDAYIKIRSNLNIKPITYESIVGNFDTLIEPDHVLHNIFKKDQTQLLFRNLFEKDQLNELQIKINQTLLENIQQQQIEGNIHNRKRYEKYIKEYQDSIKPHFIITGVGSSSCCCCCDYNQLEDNIFLESFSNGNIKLCELILSKYQQSYNFKISKQSISKTIKNNNIHIIIHFLKNHKYLFDNDILNHLKFELNNHHNYKFLNIFNT